MHAVYFLGLAALAHGYSYGATDTSVAPRSVWRSLIQRGPALAARDDNTFVWCPENQKKPDLPDAVQFQPLNTTDMGNAQNALMQWCAENNKLNPTGGQDGHVEKSGDVAVQLCNLDQKPMSCTSDQMKGFFEQLNCGDKDTPHMGALFPVPLMKLDQATFSIVFSPADHIIQCTKPTRS